MMFLEPCSTDQLERIYKEFNITEDTLKRDTKTLMEWLKMQPHLPATDDEYFLHLLFFRCKASLERTKNMLEDYYIFKAQLPELFTNRNMYSDSFKNCCYEIGTTVLMPKVTAEGHRVGIFRVNNVTADTLPSADEYLKNVLTQCIITFIACGLHKKCIFIIDYTNTSASHISLVLRTLTRTLQFTTKIIPFRNEKFYFIYNSTAVDALITMSYKFSKKLINQRTIFWKKDITALAEVVPEDTLPFEYGGNAGSFNELAEQWLKEMQSYQGWLDKDEKCVADLTKRPANRRDNNEIEEMGFEGSFRAINID